MTLNDAIALAESLGFTARYYPASRPFMANELVISGPKSNGAAGPYMRLAVIEDGINAWAEESIRQHGADLATRLALK